ncbi:MAG TPA: hypothetical protein VFH89_01035 [Sphingomicrobium sp.]|nr:hypothetical protein [Sphingomicrobium sp.]
MNAFTPVDKGALSYLEWKIVEMAREDGPRSFNPDGLVARVIRVIGIKVPNGLANERLEALRRFSVRAWFWDLIRSGDMQAFFEAGFARRHALEIISRVSMARGFTPTIENDPTPNASRSQQKKCRCG